ncbi:MAG: hypothetical protein N2515_07090, partial [Deltaproteobacteria bacterium]|nr:hypothetical protein [Deltaproteobacteria bacterium]
MPFQSKPEEKPSPSTTPSPSPPPITFFQFPEGALAIRVEGEAIECSDHVIYAAASNDFDEDGDRDVLLLTTSINRQAVAIQLAERTASGFERRDPIVTDQEYLSSSHHPDGAPGCTLERASWSSLSPSILSADIRARCEDGQTSLIIRWPVEIRPRIRVLERFTLAAKDGESLELEAKDRDEDGREDLVIQLQIQGVKDPIPITWMNRAAGLAIVEDEPESTIFTFSRRAQEAMRRNPRNAILASENAIALFETLCREAESPRFRVAAGWGLSCGKRAPGKAYALHAIALLRSLIPQPPKPSRSKRNQPSQPPKRSPFSIAASALRPAIEALIHLENPILEIQESERKSLREAIEALFPTKRFTVHHLVQSAPLPSPLPRLSSIVFVDDSHLLLRGDPPRLFELGEIPAEITLIDEMGIQRVPLRLIDHHLRNPEGQAAVVGIEQNCKGFVATIESIPQPSLALFGPFEQPSTRVSIIVEPRPASPSSG